MIFEANRLSRQPDPHDVLMHADDALRCTEGGQASALANQIAPTNTAPLAIGNGCQPTSFGRPYPATIGPADELLDRQLDQQAGNRP